MKEWESENEYDIYNDDYMDFECLEDS